MLRIMCKSKIHRVRITKTDLNYEGSIGVDKKLLDAANIYPNEIVQVLNINNGSRFETYVIGEKENSGEVVLYGPAARMGEPGDKIIVISKALVEAKEVPNIKFKIVYVDEKNAVLKKPEPDNDIHQRPFQTCKTGNPRRRQFIDTSQPRARPTAVCIERQRKPCTEHRGERLYRHELLSRSCPSRPRPSGSR